MPPMFQPGDIVFAPWRAEDASEKYRYMVVLAWSAAIGMYALWVSSVKEDKQGGLYSFTENEREQAGFPAPSRFDPRRVMHFRPEHIRSGIVHSKPGRLSGKAMTRIETAVCRARPIPQEY